ncbi:MAG: transketolase [Butyrivibrio sp.]|nr:transketolase [Butyrivibrio sp.]
MNKERVNELTLKAMDLRKVVLEMIMKSGGGHIGGDFSVMETLVTLYFDVMNISPENKDDPDRDYFIMSKGHSVESYYAVLADKGFFDTDELINTFSQFGSKFIGHPNNEIDGVEMNSGSLGHGLPVSVGMALACRMDKRPSRVYTVMGDGELAEGSVWEGFMAAGHYKLGNLCAVVDRNHLQISGTTEEVMTHENLHSQVLSFGWNVIEADGNSIEEMSKAFEEAKKVTDRPTLIIANTIKGYGGGEVMENNVSWHHHVPNEEEYQMIVKAIDARKEAVNK